MEKLEQEIELLQKHLLDLSGLVAETIRRAGASYGSREDWRRDFTRAVKIEESICKAMGGEANDI